MIEGGFIFFEILYMGVCKIVLVYLMGFLWWMWRVIVLFMDLLYRKCGMFWFFFRFVGISIIVILILVYFCIVEVLLIIGFISK